MLPDKKGNFMKQRTAVKRDEDLQGSTVKTSALAGETINPLVANFL